MTVHMRWRQMCCAIGLLLALSGCEWQGLNGLPLPGTAGRGSGSFEIQAQIPDVTNIERNSRVRVGDVTVGNVIRVERQGWHALVTMAIDGGVVLPSNTTATVGQTSLLGSLHIELETPAGVAPEGRLVNGSLIPLSAGGSYPNTEQTLSMVSMLLNGGGIGQVQDITTELTTALGDGRDADVASLVERLNEFVGRLNDQTKAIIDAGESLNNLTSQFAARRPVIDEALRTLPGALATLRDQRVNLVTALQDASKFSGLAGDAVGQSREALVQELKDAARVLKSLADAGPALTRSLDMLGTFPFPRATLDKFMRGDYSNATAIVDLTLSRIDQNFFTGTRWEGDLTELELQWGRTIGQYPSPYSAGNPLTAPYHEWQGP